LGNCEHCEEFSENWDISVHISTKEYISIFEEYSSGYIAIYSNSGDVISTPVSLRINGSVVDLELSDVIYYVAYYDFQGGTSYRVEVTYAGRNHAVNIRVPNELKITSTSPTVLNPEAPFTVNWTMQGNTDFQHLIWFAREPSTNPYVPISIEHHEEVNLPSNARSYTFPENTFPETLTWGNLGVIALNYATSGRIIFTAENSLSENWINLHVDYRTNHRINNLKNEHNRERMMRAISLIEKSR